jgi:hypothetical protein
MTNRRLSKYIDEQHAVASQTASRYGIINAFDATTFANGCITAQQLVDPIVDYYINHHSSKCYLILSSFLRVPKLNEKVGGSGTSEHCHGNAADINIYGITPKQIFNDIISGKILGKDGRPLKSIIDQCIYEYGSWCHVGRHISAPRNQFLKIENGTGYIQVYKALS